VLAGGGAEAAQQLKNFFGNLDLASPFLAVWTSSLFLAMGAGKHRCSWR